MKTSLKILALTLGLCGLAALPMGCANLSSSNSGEYNHDTDLSDRVLTKLSEDDTLRDVQVDTTQGIVTLRGSVKSGDDKDHAIRLAASVLGVQGVKSAIVVQ